MNAPEKFRVDCPCGDHVMVSEGAAGCVLTCSCGKPIQIPSSIQLRLNAGLSPIVPPEEIVEAMLIRGEVPGHETCAGCGCATSKIIRVTVECERAFVRKSGVFFMVDSCFLDERSLTGTDAIKACLRKVPEYRDLFDKFPNAKVCDEMTRRLPIQDSPRPGCSRRHRAAWPIGNSSARIR
jgi:hypothetical protein